MTVKELIEKLQAVPQDLEVFTEGCDCDGDVGSVAVETAGDSISYVYLYRL